MNKKTIAYIKDLELQIDYLIGYTPQGNHWKKEYHLREELLSNTLADESTPQEIVEKINRIQQSVYDLRNKDTLKREQGYILYTQFDYNIKRDIKIHHWLYGDL